MTGEKICNRMQSELITTVGIGAASGYVGAKIAGLFFGHAVLPLTKHLVFHGAIAGCVGIVAALALELFNCINLDEGHTKKTLAAYGISVVAIMPLYSAGVAFTLKSAVTIAGLHAVGATVLVVAAIYLSRCNKT